jgi:hypothetical protein
MRSSCTPRTHSHQHKIERKQSTGHDLLAHFLAVGFDSFAVKNVTVGNDHGATPLSALGLLLTHVGHKVLQGWQQKSATKLARTIKGMLFQVGGAQFAYHLDGRGTAAGPIGHPQLGVTVLGRQVLQHSLDLWIDHVAGRFVLHNRSLGPDHGPSRQPGPHLGGQIWGRRRCGNRSRGASVQRIAIILVDHAGRTVHVNGRVQAFYGGVVEQGDAHPAVLAMNVGENSCGSF